MNNQGSYARLALLLLSVLSYSAYSSISNAESLSGKANDVSIDDNISDKLSDQTIRVATFNVSIEAGNYLSRNDLADDPSRSVIVKQLLSGGEHSQIRNIAEIIQRVRPDILLLNEFDYISAPQEGIELFIDNFLNKSQNGQASIDYPYYYIAPVNTGLASPYDLDNDGQKSGNGADAYGFGYYSGQYGMAVLSRYPIEYDQVKTLQGFRWKDMPKALKPLNEDGSPWYSSEEWNALRLSSKSFWDVPITTEHGVVNVIASHPTPPTFDGSEDRNGRRNHDEIRLISDYLADAEYIVDDNGQQGGLASDSRFVVMGDLNSSANEGDSIKSGIIGLMKHSLVNSSCQASSEAAKQLRPDNEFSPQHTASWGLRVDYVLPSNYGLDVQQCGVFWPKKNTPAFELIKDRKASSDHRLVWLDLVIE